MDDYAARVLSEARQTLVRTAGIKVEHREHRDDGHSSDWAATMPSERAVKMIDVEQRIAEERELRDRIAGQVVAEQRRAYRAEIEEVRKEFVEDWSALRRQHLAATDRLNRKYDELLLVLSNLLEATVKLEKSLGGGDQSAEIIDLPSPWSRRG